MIRTYNSWVLCLCFSFVCAVTAVVPCALHSYWQYCAHTIAQGLGVNELEARPCKPNGYIEYSPWRGRPRCPLSSCHDGDSYKLAPSRRRLHGSLFLSNTHRAQRLRRAPAVVVKSCLATSYKQLTMWTTYEWIVVAGACSTLSLFAACVA